VEEVMKIRQVQAFYQQRAKMYQRFFVDFLQWEKVLETFFTENDFLRPGMRILDAGCGTGSVTKVLYHLSRQKGMEDITFYGFDLTPAMLALFQQWVDEEGAQRIHLQQADVLDLQNQLPSDSNSFDWIVSSAMLEYIPEENRDQALQNIKGLLKENGHILLFLTKQTWITRWTGAKWWGTNLFDREVLTAELSRAGYTTIQTHRLPKGWNAFMMAVSAGLDPGGQA
jgi:cyclopropane fatty-acyl-phospholipid synthase-like methyltransferase